MESYLDSYSYSYPNTIVLLPTPTFSYVAVSHLSYTRRAALAYYLNIRTAPNYYTLKGNLSTLLYKILRLYIYVF